MLAAALIVAALVLGIVALLIDGLRRDREIRSLRATTEEQRMLLDELKLQQHKMHLRQDRLTNIVTDRGWRDSMMLTQFNWRKPDPF